MARIVVGVDGSAGAEAAFDWALEEARMRGAEVVIVHAWSLPYYIMGVPGGAAPILPVDALEEGARAVLDKTVDGARERSKGVDVRAKLLPGPASQMLLQEAEKADLLVVGSRGLGGFRGLLLGSVSHQCAQHAPCPVVIVPLVEEETA